LIPAVVSTLGWVADGQNVTVSFLFNTMDRQSWTGEDLHQDIRKGRKVNLISNQIK